METNYEWIPVTREEVMNNNPYTPIVEKGIEEIDD